MIKILFITFLIKKYKRDTIINSLKKNCDLYIVDDYQDFLKIKNIFFDFTLTAAFWIIKWAEHISEKKYLENIPDYVKYKNIIYIESNPIFSIYESIYYNEEIRKKYGKKFFLDRYSIGNLEISKQKNIINEMVIEKRKKYNIILKPYKKKNDNLCILILLQNYFNQFLNMSLNEYEKYIQNIILKIRNLSNNKIIIRYKPTPDSDHRCYKINLTDPNNNLEISSEKTLEHDLSRSYVVIAHSTNAVIKACLEGLYIIALSPYCLCYEVANHNIEDINNLKKFDREYFINKIVSCSWDYEDIENGNLFKYFSLHIKS